MRIKHASLKDRYLKGEDVRKQANELGNGHGFIVGGSRQLAKGIRATIEKEVEEEFSDRLAKANWHERLRLRWHMRAEIDRRTATDIAKQMPSKEALW